MKISNDHKCHPTPLQEQLSLRRNFAIPDGILLRIFLHLPLETLLQCACVCKEWYWISTNPSLWSEIDLSFHFPKITNEVISAIGKRSNLSLTSITLRNCSKISDAAILELISTCKNLRSIDLTYCPNVCDASLFGMAFHCNQLCSLTMKYNELITNKGVYEICVNCPNIQYLDMSHTPETTTDCLPFIAFYLTHLRSLNFARMFDTAAGLRWTHGPNYGLPDLPSNPIRFPNTLEWLDLGQCKDIDPERLITLIRGRRRKLRVLKLVECTQITDIVLVRLSSSMRSLRYFDVKYCNEITDFGIVNVIRNTPNLEKLEIEDCRHITDATLRSLAMFCPRLVHLGLSGCQHISDDGLRYLVEDEASNINLVVLEVDSCTRLTDKLLEMLSERFRKRKRVSLERLGLCDCSGIRGTAIDEFKHRFEQVEVNAYYTIHLEAIRPVRSFRRRVLARCGFSGCPSWCRPM